jgi:hypothetical protein
VEAVMAKDYMQVVSKNDSQDPCKITIGLGGVTLYVVNKNTTQSIKATVAKKQYKDLQPQFKPDDPPTETHTFAPQEEKSYGCSGPDQNNVTLKIEVVDAVFV